MLQQMVFSLLNVGIIGYEPSTTEQYYIPSLQRLATVVISAIADSRKDKLQQARSKVKCKNYLKSIDKKEAQKRD